MFQINKIFLGNTPGPQRKWLCAFLKHAVKTRPKVVIPCCGQFALASIALEAGYEPQNIRASDISLFSSVLGYLYTGKSISSLPVQLLAPYDAIYEGYRTDLDRAAFLFCLMKIKQFREKVYFEKMYKREIAENLGDYTRKMAERLEKMRAKYAGIHYEMADLRNDLREHDDDTIVLVNPPAYRGGYEKMFNFEPEITWTVDVDEFDWKDEYVPLYEKVRALSTPFVWYRYQNTTGLPKEDVVFGKEYFPGQRVNYWLLTKPEMLRGSGISTKTVQNTPKDYKGVSASIVEPNYEITPDTKISFKEVTQEVSLYYRDLWAHKLGNTKAEGYYLMLLDGKVFGTFGMHYQAMKTLKEDKCFECFGFNAPLILYPNANRLLMMAITSTAFRDFINARYRRNRIYDLNGFKTTCLSKYRKVKLNNGLLTMTKREKLPNGMYKIMYETPFHERDLWKVVEDYLRELE